MRLGEIPNQFANQFVRTLMPLASGLHAERDWTRLRAMYVASTRLALAIAAPLAVILTVLAPSLLSIWVGPEYARPLADRAADLACPASPGSASIRPAPMLQGMDRHKILAITSILNGLLNLGLSLFLVRPHGDRRRCARARWFRPCSKAVI